MKYYKILNSIETKEIGHFPQEKTIKWEGMPYEKDSFANQSLFNPVIGKPALPIPEFYKSAKMTSLVSVSNIPLNKYLVVNQKLLDFIKPFLNDFQSWKIEIKRNIENFEYYILHINQYQNDFINYEKSVFKLFKNDESYNKIDLDKEIEIESDEDFLNKLRYYSLQGVGVGYPFLKEVKVVFNNNKMQDKLLRSAFLPFSGYYVSEELKDDIIKNGFTGIDFKEQNQIDNFVEILTE